MITKTLHWAAAAGALCSAVGFLWAGLHWIAAVEVACAVGLAIGFWKPPHLARICQLLLLLQAVIVGAIWPSALTIAALLVLPGIFLVLRDAFKRTSTPGWQLYMYGSVAIAAWSLAAEGWLLATLSRG